MRMNLLVLLLGAGVGLAGGVSPAGAAQPTEAVTVAISPASASVVLGEALDLQVRVTNDSAQRSAPLVVHLDITDPNTAKSVDPEDWTPTLNKPLDGIEPHQTVTLDWTVQPISAGSFSLYAVALTLALTPGADALASSNVVKIAVADRRSLNPGGSCRSRSRSPPPSEACS